MYLDFKAISAAISFRVLLDHLNIEYEKKGKDELKGVGKFKFIVNVGKNLFLCPDDENIKGSVINFYASHADVGLREAAQWLQETFLAKVKPPKREIPELELKYHVFLEQQGITEETATMFEVGYCGKKSIMTDIPHLTKPFF